MGKQQHELRESHLRSLLKGISWRILASFTTVTIAYFITGKVDVAFQIGGIEVIAKILIYYFHERAWQLIPRGTVRKLYQIPAPQASSDENETLYGIPNEQ